jgi:hypothetical protein
MLVATLAGLLPVGAQGSFLEPLTPGWEDAFTIQWDAATWRGRPVLEGRLVNTSPYTLGSVKLLAESLDASGAIVAQHVGWVQGVLAPFSGTYFSVAAPEPAVGYRIRVFSYDRIEAGERDFK